METKPASRTKRNDPPTQESGGLPEDFMDDLGAQGVVIEEFREGKGDEPRPGLFSLHSKKARVAASLEIIAKDGTNQAQGFKYATHTSLITALKPILEREGLILHSTCLDSKTQLIERPGKGPSYLVEVRMAYHLIDLESGEHDESVFFGQALDTGDKALYKAYTGALKYFLFQNFLIVTGDAKHDEVETDEEMLHREKIAAKVMTQAGFKGKIDYSKNPGEWEMISECSKRGQKLSSIPTAYLQKAIMNHQESLEKDDIAYITQYLSQIGHLPVVPGAL